MNGMPNILNYIPREVIDNQIISLGGAGLINTVFGKRWGIFNEFGIPIVLSDTFVGMNYSAGAEISKYPTEKGSFASYNKVNNPSMANVTLAKGSGGAVGRGLFLTQLETLLKSTLKFNIVVPEYIYINYQITRIDLARTAQDNAAMVTVDLGLEEVIESVVDYDIEKVKAPSDSNTVDGGAKASTQKESQISIGATKAGLFGR